MKHNPNKGVFLIKVAARDLAKANGVGDTAVHNVIAWGNGIVDTSPTPSSEANGRSSWEPRLCPHTAAPSAAAAADAAVSHMKALACGSNGK